MKSRMLLGLPAHEGGYRRHPLAYLVEGADDICYCVLDLEDTVELGILPFTEAADVLLRTVDGATRKRLELEIADPKRFRVNFTRIRGHVFAALIEGAVEGFMKSYGDIMAGRPAQPVFDALGTTDARNMFINTSKSVGRERIYTDSKKVEVELGAFATLDVLLSEMCVRFAHRLVAAEITGFKIQNVVEE